VKNVQNYIKKVLTEPAPSEKLSTHTEQQRTNMRTKTLLLTAALIAAGALPSLAQSNVYSVNVVGYVNVPITNGYNFIANPLDFDGTGTNNTITTAFGNSLPSGSQVFKFSGGVFGQSDFYITGPGWLSGGTISLNPGEGIVLQSAGNGSVTFAGTVLQGTRTTAIPLGFAIISSKVPVGGPITSVLNLQPSNGDQLLPWDPVAQGYTSSFLYVTGPGWLPSEPSLAVGQASFIQTVASNNWTTNFVVQ